MLIYNPATDCYEGERLSVPRWRWNEGVAELVEGGMDDVAACRRLLREEQWLGVEGTCLSPLCLHCGEALPAGRQFCDVLCHAAFIVEANG